MEKFYPFIYQPKRNDKELEPQPLYVELWPQLPEKKQEEQEEPERVLIIEIL